MIFENNLVVFVVAFTVLLCGFLLFRKSIRQRKKVDQAVAPQPDSKTAYKAYLRSAEWRALKTLALERADFKCELCGEFYTTVHHVKYPKRYNEDHLDNLWVVCQKCHDKLHGIREEPKPPEREVLFAQKISTSSRTYFFDVKNTVNGDKYLVITEREKTGHDLFERHHVIIFEEDFDRFVAGLREALNKMKENAI
jgi:hypothetical protein